MKKGTRKATRGSTRTAAVVLAAGKGTRMRSSTAKVLHPLCGMPLGAWPIEAARLAGTDPIVVVVGHQGGFARDALSEAAPRARLRFAVQAEQRGTGHAVMCAWPEIERSGADHVLILCGDVPSLLPSTLERLSRAGTRAQAALITFEPKDPASYGRVVRDAKGRVIEIVEAADATRAQKRIREVNSGIYCVSTALLREALKGLCSDNAQGELYLTDLVAHASKSGVSVATIEASEDEVEGVNDRADLARAEARARARINDGLMRAGVSFEDPAATYVEARVTAGRDVFLGAGVHLSGDTRVGNGARVEAYSMLHDTRVGAKARVKPHCVIESAEIGREAQVGPFARIRPGSVLDPTSAVGNFVEVKKAHLGRGVKAGHLSYLGDADIGASTNIGAGTITCNYDGASKHRTTIGARAFIGSNTALVAPVEIGAGAYVGAGSTVTRSIPDGALGVARGKQRNLDGWARRKRGGKTSRSRKTKAPARSPGLEKAGGGDDEMGDDLS